MDLQVLREVVSIRFWFCSIYLSTYIGCRVFFPTTKNYIKPIFMNILYVSFHDRHKKGYISDFIVTKWVFYLCCNILEEYHVHIVQIFEKKTFLYAGLFFSPTSWWNTKCIFDCFSFNFHLISSINDLFTFTLFVRTELKVVL